MKKLLTPISFFAMLILLTATACEGGGAAEGGGKTKKEVIHETVTRSYGLVLSEGIHGWERKLHQGKTKQKMKLFGAEVEMELGEVNMTSSGDFELTEGSLKRVGDDLQSGQLTFDMSTMKINKNMEKGDDLFKTKEFPHSTFVIKEMVQDSIDYYTLKADLTIADVTNEVEAQAFIAPTENKGLMFNSKFTIQTLDWPLREDDAAKAVIQDEITINLDLIFHETEVKRDTTIEEVWE